MQYWFYVHKNNWAFWGNIFLGVYSTSTSFVPYVSIFFLLRNGIKIASWTNGMSRRDAQDERFPRCRYHDPVKGRKNDEETKKRRKEKDGFEEDDAWLDRMLSLWIWNGSGWRLWDRLLPCMVSEKKATQSKQFRFLTNPSLHPLQVYTIPLA